MFKSLIKRIKIKLCCYSKCSLNEDKDDLDKNNSFNNKISNV